MRLPDADFRWLANLLERESGLVFDETRRDALAYSVAQRVRKTGCADLATYLIRLGDPVELQHLLDAVTIPETHFFRNPPQIRALRLHVLPALLRRAAGRDRRLRVWSAGCATGEEPYTVAMLLRELLPDPTGWDLRILGTDVSATALAFARAASYGQRSLVMAAPEDAHRWFDRVADSYLVRPEVRELVEFRRHNLVTDEPPFGPDEADLVLCRNVTIYFARETTRALVHRLHERIAPGGYLFLGHAETLWQVSDDFQLVELGDAFVYQRAEPRPDRASKSPGQDYPFPDRRHVLPNRRTEPEGPPPGGLGPERRQGARRAGLPDRTAGQPDRTADRPVDPAGTEVPPAGSPSAALLAAARASLAAGDYEAAAQRAGAAALIEPMCGEAWYLRGIALVNAGRDDEAIVELRKASYADPAAGVTYFVLAGALARTGRLAAAARAYRAAARTLGRRGDEVASELGGRTVPELIELCRQLADKLDSRADELDDGEI